ncbi:MAG: CoA transferase [Chloroflexi bacterium]|nr:CoA transferase [Chloroflexota bacterium]
MSGPLAGIRVLDVGVMLAGPFGATLLADFGAEVIKVELPGSGDPLRHGGVQHHGHALGWLVEGRNKKCITLDLRLPDGQELFRRLVAHVDVVIENFTPGTFERWGLGEEALRAVNPRLVLVRVSGFGQDGPYRLRTGFDRVAQAFGGGTYVTGHPECPPVRSGLTVADYVAGLYNALSVLMALYHRDARQGESQTVDLALFEGVFRMTRDMLAEYDLTGRVRERSGNVNPNAAPGDTFQTRDGRWAMIVGATQGTWENLAQAMGRPDLIDDPRFRTNPDRVAHASELNELIADWVGALDWREVDATLDAHGVPASLIYSIADIAADEHYRARGAIVTVPHPELGTVRMPGVGPRLSKTPGAVRHAGPALGAHNEEVYGGLLGLCAAELAALRERGVI